MTLVPAAPVDCADSFSDFPPPRLSTAAHRASCSDGCVSPDGRLLSRGRGGRGRAHLVAEGGNAWVCGCMGGGLPGVCLGSPLGLPLGLGCPSAWVAPSSSLVRLLGCPGPLAWLAPSSSLGLPLEPWVEALGEALAHLQPSGGCGHRRDGRNRARGRRGGHGLHVKKHQWGVG